MIYQVNFSGYMIVEADSEDDAYDKANCEDYIEQSMSIDEDNIVEIPDYE